MSSESARVHSARGPRAIAAQLARLWLGSLRFRTMVIAIGLSAVALLIGFVLMSFAIQDNLFQSRVQQSLVDARRATTQAQKTLDAADIGGSAGKLNELITTVRGQVELLSGTTLSAGLLDPAAQPNPLAPTQWSTGLETDLLTSALRQQVRDKSGSSWWQSTGIPQADGSVTPAIIVGQQLSVPEVGPYELYLAYDLSSQQRTLAFVQGALWIAGIVLIALIGAIMWMVLRVVIDPITEAARTSQRFAAGDLGARIRVEGEDEVSTLGVSFNVMADSIERQIVELGELSLVQQRFVSDVSHELRTPLTTIRLASDMLNDRRDEFDPVTARSAELMHTQVQRFEVLLQDLLEISRYDAGSVQLEREPTSLVSLAEDVIDQMQPLAQQHGSDLRLVAPGGYSLVEMDPRRVRRVVRNLIGNAIEHGEGKPIVVSVDSDQQAVAIGVRDFGLGMRQEDTERVFDRFWRADPSRKRTIGGTGLGLSIALGDAKLHDGTLEVWSELGVGTNFVLTLPRQAGIELLPNASPIPLVAAGDIAPFDELGLTEPIALPSERRPDA